MKAKIILVLMFVCSFFVAKSQDRVIVSLDKTYKAEFYSLWMDTLMIDYPQKGHNQTLGIYYTPYFELSFNGWKKTVNLERLWGSNAGFNRGGVYGAKFSDDNKKIYISFCRFRTYEYDIETDTFKRMFDEKNNDVHIYCYADSDTLILRSHIKKYMQTNTFYKYINGKYINYAPNVYYDFYSKNCGYIMNGKPCTFEDEDWFEAKRILDEEFKLANEHVVKLEVVKFSVKR